MEEINNPYIKVLSRKSSRKLVIAFSAGSAEGKFHYYKLMGGIDASVILVNCPDDSYYHFGIPSIGALDKTCQHIKNLCDSILDIDGEIVTFGCSMAGYGALLFGSILKVDKVIAFSATCPKYTPRTAVLNDLERHTERYYQFKNIIAQSDCKKLLIYGGIDPQDHASYLEFEGLLNSEFVLLAGANHQIIEPLLYRYNIQYLLGLTSVSFLEDSINLDDSCFMEYSKAVLDYRYKESGVTTSELIELADKSKNEIFKNDFYTLLYAIQLFEIDSDGQLIPLFVTESLKIERQVNFLSLYLLTKTLTLHSTEFVLEYCSRGVEYANNKNLMSAEECFKMSKAIVEIVNSLNDKTVASNFFQEHKLMDVAFSITPSESISNTKNQKSKFIFSKLKLGEDVEVADMLRDTAIAFKMSGDLVTACAIMEKALEQRPNGPFIRKTLYEYLNELNVIKGVNATGALNE